ncbi:MAG: LacI family DNA-binding transcriptional regulator [Thermoleophilaceae bacterium]|nr:LacI family DNA-binding transcriptional regulator [Thermoleophilaceae bacterium]
MRTARRRTANAGRRGWASQRPTINDVAALSGVSKSTVSNVLRGTGRVSGATRTRVLEAIEALGYRPNALARDLVRRRSNTLGVLVGDLANTFYAELVKLMELQASDAAFTTMVCNTNGNFALERARVETLLERAVLGVVLLQFSGDRTVLEELRAARVPVVVVSCSDERADCVAVDDAAGMRAAVEHLHSLGHRAIAHVTGHLLEETTRAERFAGYERAMRDRGLSPRLLSADDWEHGSPEAIRSLRELVTGPDRLTAFAAGNDVMAIRLMDALEAAGLRVPEDVSVTGFDGIELGAHSRIGLTTVSQPRVELVTRGLELLLDRIRGDSPTAAPRRVTLAPQLVVRDSTAPPPTRPSHGRALGRQAGRE